MTSDKPLISIVIPSYNRTDILFEAILSCFDQAYRPLEIVIGDDSTTDAVGRMVEKIECPPGVTIRYQRHIPSRKQSGNVNWLFSQARGSRLLLLHDDDLLWPGGLDRLESVWRNHPTAACVFGKQVMISQEGIVDVDDSIKINSMYSRSNQPTGVQAPAETIGLIQQIPNNCFLIDTDLAREIGYREESVVGLAADADFGIRLSLAMGKRDFVYANYWVSAYRITHVSMMRGVHRNQDHHLFFNFVQNLKLPASAEFARRICLDRYGSAAALDAANAGDLVMARRIVASEHYSRSVFSVHGLMTRLSIANPRFGAALRPRMKAVVQNTRRLTERLRNSKREEDVTLSERSSDYLALNELVQPHREATKAREAAYNILRASRAAA